MTPNHTISKPTENYRELRLLAARTAGLLGVLVAMAVFVFWFTLWQDMTRDSFRDGEAGHIGWIATTWLWVIGILALTMLLGGILSIAQRARILIQFLSAAAVCLFVALLIGGAQTWLLSSVGSLIATSLFLLNTSRHFSHDV